VKANHGIGATAAVVVGRFSPTFHPKKDRGHDCDGGGGGDRGRTTVERRRPRSSLSARGGESFMGSFCPLA